MRQFCKVCGHADHFDFHVADEVWKAVLPEAFHTRVVCLSCFDRFASARGIDYRPALNPTIWFVGQTVTLKLRALPVLFLAQTLIAELAGRGFAARMRRVVRRWPLGAVRAEVPRVRAIELAVVVPRHMSPLARLASILTSLSNAVVSSVVPAIRNGSTALSSRTAVEGIVPKNERWKPCGFEERNELIALACQHLVRIYDPASKTYGSGWTADLAEREGAVVERIAVPRTVTTPPAQPKSSGAPT